MASTQPTQTPHFLVILLCAASIACQAPVQDDHESAQKSAQAHVAFQDDAPECIEGLPDPANQRMYENLTKGSLFIASLVDPSFPLDVQIYIDRMEYGPEKLTKTELKARIAAHQAPILARLKELGGKLVRSYSTSSRLWVTLPARHAPDVRCWPEILAFGVITKYWDVVEPPWDADTVGEMECPVVDDSCPFQCSPIMGNRLDEARGCVTTSERIACFRGPSTTAAFWDGCAEKLATGEFFRFSGGAIPREPLIRDWRECTNAERQRLNVVPFCD